MAARGLGGARCLVSANFRKSPKLKGGGRGEQARKKKKPQSCALLPAGGRHGCQEGGLKNPQAAGWRVEPPPPPP